MTELFNLPETPSPRLAWMRKHGVWIRENREINPGDESPETGETIYPFKAFGNQFVGYGNTEDEAIADFAKRAGVRLWNEVGV